MIVSKAVGTTGASVRGFTKGALWLNEGSRLPEFVFEAAKPMLLTTAGEIWMDSTPFGKQGYFYDASRRMEVEQIQITSRGVEATTPEGEQILDIHHLDHPDKEYDDDDLVCFGFTSHYKTMRERFGEHMVDGIAGENIIIEYDQEVWESDLGKRVAIENKKNGHKTFFDMESFAAPCKEFSLFTTKSQDKELPAAELKATLQFLNNGRRGFLLVMTKEQERATVQAGDKVFVVAE